MGSEFAARDPQRTERSDGGPDKGARPVRGRERSLSHGWDGRAKSWIWRGVVRGRRRELGLGSVRRYSLAEARELARHYRKAAREGRDPKAERDAAIRQSETFRDAATRSWRETVEPTKSPKTAARWRSTVEVYAVPRLGNLPVADVSPEDVLAVLRPIWLAKPETARRVLQRVRAVFDWAIVAGLRTDANPAGAVRIALPPQKDQSAHFAALPYAEVPALMARLTTVNGIGALALRFTILTAARSGETRGAHWSEFDLAGATWTIPAERVKMKTGHRVPLSDPVIAILEFVRELPGALVFPGIRDPERPLSDMTLTATLRRLDVPATVHGFRSSFRDWAEERTDFAHEIKEAALAHKISNAVERAYRRTDLLDRRRALMNEWAAFCTGANDG